MNFIITVFFVETLTHILFRFHKSFRKKKVNHNIYFLTVFKCYFEFIKCFQILYKIYLFFVVN